MPNTIMEVVPAPLQVVRTAVGGFNDGVVELSANWTLRGLAKSLVIASTAAADEIPPDVVLVGSDTPSRSHTRRGRIVLKAKSVRYGEEYDG